jgi:two-component system chemotaxis response regulator CheB
MKRTIIVIGASAGGIEALRIITAGLPPDFLGSVCAVVHTASNSPGLLAPILERAGKLPVRCVKSREPMQPGHIYVPAPDHHLLVEKKAVNVSRGPKENRFRPAVDPLFRSAAYAYGPQVIGIVLTGGLDDGTAGLAVIKQLGGTTIVQDPADALYPSMPRSAMRHVKIDHCVPLAGIAPLLVSLVNKEVMEKEISIPEGLKTEVAIANEAQSIEAAVGKLGKPSIYTCPECGGVLLDISSGELIRFRCHVGHAYSAQSLMAEIDQQVEASLWSSVRTIEEKVFLLRHLAKHASQDTFSMKPEQLLERADSFQRQAEMVRQTLFQLS